jgi:hypothetical protein
MKFNVSCERRARFAVRSLMAVLALFAVGVVGASRCCAVDRTVRYQDILVTIRVVDAESRKPVARVRVTIDNLKMNEDLGENSSGETSPTGQVELTHRFFTIAEKQAALETLHVYFQGPWLEVSAPGYQAKSLPLSDVIGQRSEIGGPARPEAVLELKPGRTPSPKLSELVGWYEYANPGFWRETIQLNIDSTYESSMFYHEEPGDRKSAGTFEVVDGRIHLRATNRESAKSRRDLKNDLVPVSWGDRLYLVAASERLKFCNEINRGDAPSFVPSRPPSVAEMGKQAPRPGLPTLPREWNNLWLAKPIVGKVAEVITGPYARVNLGARDGVRAGMILHGGEAFGIFELTVCAVESGNCVVKSRSILKRSGSSPAPTVGTTVKSRSPLFAR